MKKILFPTDFSEPSKNAFRYALLLADQIDASIKVIHATLPTDDIETYAGQQFSTKNLLVDFKKETKTFVESGITQVLNQLENAPIVSMDVLLGTPINTIVNLAKEEEVALILMGSRGKNKSRLDRMLGSFAAGVVERTTTQVLIIPEHADFQPTKRIAYASNLLDTDPFKIWKVINFMGETIKQVDIIHILLKDESKERVESHMKEMSMFFSDRFMGRIDFEYHIISGLSLQKELDRFTAKHHPDVMVMYQPRPVFWNKLFFKSYTKERTVLTQIPLLVQKEGI